MPAPVTSVCDADLCDLQTRLWNHLARHLAQYRLGGGHRHRDPGIPLGPPRPTAPADLPTHELWHQESRGRAAKSRWFRPA